MSLPELLAAESGSAMAGAAAAKRVIVILEQGGLSHIDTWDPKPDVGSVVSLLMGTNNQSLPPYVMVPGNSEQAAETRTGILPKSLSAFKTGGHDLSDRKWEVADLLARVDNSGSRLNNRQQLLASLDHRFDSDSDKLSLHGMDRFYEQAFNSLTSQDVAHAWDHHDLIYAPGSCGTIRDKAGGTATGERRWFRPASLFGYRHWSPGRSQRIIGATHFERPGDTGMGQCARRGCICSRTRWRGTHWIGANRRIQQAVDRQAVNYDTT